MLHAKFNIAILKVMTIKRGIMRKIQFSSKGIIASFTLLSAALIAPNVSATNGLYGIGYGAKQTAIAGSGVAFAQDPLIAALNPAGVVEVGDQSVVNLQYFSPSREYTVDGSSGGAAIPIPGSTVESNSESFFIPSMAFSWMISPDAAVGFAIYGNGGMSTDYSARDTPFGAGTFAGGDTGVDYTQIFTNFNYSRKFADGAASWGIGAIINYSYLEMKGLAAFGGSSTDPDALTNNGYDHSLGFGLKLGVLGEVMPGIKLGGSYQTKIENEFDDYEGLFTNGGEFDIPATAQVGIAADVGPGVLTFDVQEIFYSDVDAIGNTSRSLLTGGQLGDSVGFGWDDMTVYKLGYTWAGADGWTWRLGASYGEQPIPGNETTINIIAPGVIEQHYTAGFSKVLDSGNEVSLAFMYAPEECVSGASLLAPSDSVEICMDQYSIDVGLSF